VVAAGVGLLALLAPAAGGTSGSAGGFRLVIAQPVTAPARAVAGKPFTVSFAVTRSDTKAPVRSGTLICDPAVGGTVIKHAESFTGGTARLRFVVPAGASGKSLVVNVTIKAQGKSAHRVAVFQVGAAAKPSLSIADGSVSEGNTGTTALGFAVTLSSPASGVVTVSYSTSDGTAAAPGDYVSASGTVAFKPGETSKTITVSVVGDTAYEPDETLTVALASPVNATLVQTSATGTIRNDDPAPPPVKAGHYAGTYSDGSMFNFDVQGMSLTNLVFDFNGHCSGGTMAGPPTRITGAFPIGSDGAVSGHITLKYTNASGSADFSGKLASSGSGSGSLSIGITFNDGTNCTSSGTWNAQAQG
jgi:hypothetical protein